MQQNRSQRSMAQIRNERLWRWRCQWAVVTLAAIGIVLYNAAANLWLLRPTNCFYSTTSLPQIIEQTCEPCLETAPNSIVVDDPISRLDLNLGRWDNTRSYKLFDYAAVGDMYVDASASRQVALATQSSIERLHELLATTAHWSGPVSVAVFIVGDELRLLRAFTMWLFRCQPELYSRMAIHVATPGLKLAVHGEVPSWARNCDAKPSLMGKGEPDSAWRSRHPYPQNHLRNLARKNCHSQYTFLVDIDIVPSKGMAEELDIFFTKTPKCELCAYVIPTYELDTRVANFPVNKKALLRLSKNKLAVPFHRRVFIYNQYASNFTRWESTGGNESLATHVSHNVTNFELLYEPFYVASDTVPPHDERFLGYGFTRNTQVYEMFLVGYQFQVLSPIFTIHWGLQLRRNRPLWREKQNAKNRKHFETFKRELFARYRRDPLHLLRKNVQAKKT
ncbi:beta-1,4-glucuronyltransferase 1 [Leptidea sinapis]|uniref:beta-1,4-glucuronyltransferase 1 n=1 Tax=Leptidea sinapis TaxID=189913 RepID=UPI0021C3F10B|nr:beta-1,4-glucuronyltransferase 1 [Leptidea sinapis]